MGGGKEGGEREKQKANVKKRTERVQEEIVHPLQVLWQAQRSTGTLLPRLLLRRPSLPSPNSLLPVLHLPIPILVLCLIPLGLDGTLATGRRLPSALVAVVLLAVVLVLRVGLGGRGGAIVGQSAENGGGEDLERLAARGRGGHVDRRERQRKADALLAGKKARERRTGKSLEHARTRLNVGDALLNRGRVIDVSERDVPQTVEVRDSG
jgi:hypothetical protein